MFYRLIVIENSLKDKNIISGYEVLSETTFTAGDPVRESRMLKIRVPEIELPKLVNLLMNNIKSPYYCHLYAEDPKVDVLVVIFSDQLFRVQKTDYKLAVAYGVSHGVSPEEMQISPLDVAKEEW